MGERRLGKAPPDLGIYELALALGKFPDEVREMPVDDRTWLSVVLKAKALADEEMWRRRLFK